jgi:hypothetical protein
MELSHHCVRIPSEVSQRYRQDTESERAGPDAVLVTYIAALGWQASAESQQCDGKAGGAAVVWRIGAAWGRKRPVAASASS